MTFVIFVEKTGGRHETMVDQKVDWQIFFRGTCHNHTTPSTVAKAAKAPDSETGDEDIYCTSNYSMKCISITYFTYDWIFIKHYHKLLH